jgi:hypothetical protein
MATLVNQVDLSQPLNDLGKTGVERRDTVLIPKNDYSPESNQYSSTNPDAISDGDIFGKGTGIFLDTQNGGSKDDITSRTSNIVTNRYKSNSVYTTPSL